MKFIFIITFFVNVVFAQEEKERKYNIRTTPIHLIFGVISFFAEKKLNNHFSLGPMITYLDTKNNDLTTSTRYYGVRGNYFITNKTFHDSIYLGAHVSYFNSFLKEEDTFYPFKKTVSAFSYGGFLGYYWLWKQINIQFGAGFISHTNDKSVVLKNSQDESKLVRNQDSSGTRIDLELSVGFSF